MIPHRVIRLCLYVLLTLPCAHALAQATVAAPLKQTAILYVNDGTAAAAEHANMIHRMVTKAGGDFTFSIKEYPLKSESELRAQIEKIADDEIGLIVIVEPRDANSLMKIPGLYPDIRFSIIGATVPLYAANVQSLLFNEQEGMFLMGTLAALHSKTGVVAFIGDDDDEATRNLAFAFFEGAKHTNSAISVSQQLGNRVFRGTSASSSVAAASAESAIDVRFILNDDAMESYVQSAEAQKRLIITYNRDLTGTHPGLVLTSLLKHYDLAIGLGLRRYARGTWHSGSKMLGLDDGFIDYVLNQNNKNLMPKDIIDQLETTKDLISQHIIAISNLEK